MDKEYNDLTEDDYEHYSDDVDGTTIYFKVAETEMTQQEFSDLSEDDCEFIFQSLILADSLLKKNTAENSLNNYSFEVLDTLIDQYNDTPGNFDCTVNGFINSIGAAFGHLLNKQLGTKWTVVSDEYGEDFACQISELHLTAFPLNSVAKAIEQKREGSLETIHLMLKRQKADLEKEGRV